MKTQHDSLLEVLRRSQQWGSPFLLWFMVELLGGGACMLLMFPVSLILAIVCWKVAGDLAGLMGMTAPLILAVEVWNAIKRKVKDH